MKALASRYLDTSSNWPRIYNRNRRRIPSTHVLTAGWCIWIPSWEGKVRSDQCSWGLPRTGTPPDPRTLKAAARLGLSWWNLTESKLRTATERVTGYRNDVPWWEWPGTLSSRVTRFLTWAVVARALDVAYGSSAVGYKKGMRLVWGSRLPRALNPSANMFTVGNSVFIRPTYTPREAEYAHEYIHTLEYLGSSQVEIVTRYGIEELYSGEFGSGSVGNRLEAIAYLWQGWIETYGRPGILAKPRKPWSIWTLPTVL